MEKVEVIPGSYLPIGGAQHYTYELTKQASTGTVVNVNLAGRKIRGVVISETPKQKKATTPKFKIKKAEPVPYSLPARQLQLAWDIAKNYRASLSSVVKMMLPPAGPLDKIETHFESSQKLEKPELNDAQEDVYLNIKKKYGQTSSFLLFGVTGSGKTEVYLRAAYDLLKKKQQVLMLVPEIAMTPHLADRLKKFFGSHVIIWHSALTNLEKRKNWVRLAKGLPSLVIGPRSALFLPLPKLALIVIDEEHDASYKQTEQEPRFHARAAASLLSRRVKCPLILGSATPSSETWHQVQLGNIKKLVLNKRYGDASLPQVELIDTRGVPSSIAISDPVLESIEKTLNKNKQVIVLINRRGSAAVTICHACGNIERCTKCERPLILHKSPQEHLACHYCDVKKSKPTKCSKCSAAIFNYLGTGTQSLTAQLKTHFPAANVERLDRDIATSKPKLKSLNEDLHSGKIDILVGTQLVAKGWDLERLHLVVVVDADHGLFMPDFRAHERTVQLLWQVAGRAGRRKEKGQVLIQTLNPDHPALKALINANYEQFIMSELQERKHYGFPPYGRLIKLSSTAATSEARHKLDGSFIESYEKALTNNPLLEKNTTVFPSSEKILPRGRKTLQRLVVTDNPQNIFKLVPSKTILDVDPEDFLF